MRLFPSTAWLLKGELKPVRRSWRETPQRRSVNQRKGRAYQLLITTRPWTRLHAWMEKKLDGQGVKGVDIARMYAYDGEIRSTKPRQHSDPVDYEGAAFHVDSFDESDKVLAEYVLASASIDIHKKRQKRADRKSGCRNMSLHQAAIAYHLADTSRDLKFDRLLKSLETATDMTQKQSTELRAGTKRLYREFLVQFKGIICSTPMAVADAEFRNWFHPHLITVDEGGRLPENELLTVLAFYDAPVIVVGDHHQLPPYLKFNANAKNDLQSSNPIAPQLRYSTTERAVDAGAIETFMQFNHRSSGFLHKVPSQLIYRDLMTPFSRANQWSSLTETYHKFLLELAPELPKNETRLMVTLEGSWDSYIGTSARNIAHARWIVATSIKAVHDKTLTSRDGSPMDILIMAYYRAQVQTIEQMLNQAVIDGKLTREQRLQIRVQTLDLSQGGEADLVFVDYTRTGDTSFTSSALFFPFQLNRLIN
ncbi:hypothetical protein GE09DRAFT_1269540 [Coniochaeta sp. 2T2.1]|nr:hypothetical protein GE09DRAFT_1269540 [Coniochaeta sp. 2T2.1]